MTNGELFMLEQQTAEIAALREDVKNLKLAVTHLINAVASFGNATTTDANAPMMTEGCLKAYAAMLAVEAVRS